MPRIRLIPALPAALIIARYHDTGEVVVLVDADQPRRRILGMARPLLPLEERRELARVLTH